MYSKLDPFVQPVKNFFREIWPSIIAFTLFRIGIDFLIWGHTDPQWDSMWIRIVGGTLIWIGIEVQTKYRMEAFAKSLFTTDKEEKED